MVVVLPGLIFLFDAGDQVADGIDLERLWNLRLRLRFGSRVGLLLVRVRRIAGGDQGWSLGGWRRHKGCFLGTLTGERRC